MGVRRETMISKYLDDPPIPTPRRPRGWKSSFTRHFHYSALHHKVFQWSVKHLRRQYKPRRTIEISRALAWLRTHDKVPCLFIWQQILRGTYRTHDAHKDRASDVQYSDVYECPECGDRNVQYTQMQTRSADEGMTSFCQCMSCKYRWKEN